MKYIELEELQKHLSYLEGNEPLTIEKKGEILGFYYPKNKPNLESLKEAFELLNATLDQMALESGMGREELIDALDPSKPFPFSENDSNC
jgi:hypothetical protein